MLFHAAECKEVWKEAGSQAYPAIGRGIYAIDTQDKTGKRICGSVPGIDFLPVPVWDHADFRFFAVPG